MPGSESDSETGEETDPTWEIPEDSGGGGGEGSDGGSEGGWQTSNEIPGNPGSEGTSEGDGDTAGSDSDDAAQGIPGSGGEGGSDAELEGALKDFDGEILAERDIIRSSSGSGSGLELPTEEEGTDGGPGGDSQVGGPLPPKRAIPPAPAPPRRGSEAIPDDIPDANDDDIIARHLREAAMQEEDPVLKHKLWEEYRKYKKG